VQGQEKLTIYLLLLPAPAPATCSCYLPLLPAPATCPCYLPLLPAPASDLKHPKRLILSPGSTFFIHSR
jgi:hypothetical protein